MIVHAYPHPVFASIPDALVAADHRAVYGDPIDTMLGAAGAGTVLGADARCDEAGRVVAVELDVALADLDGSLETLRRSLCTLGAPGDSVLAFTRRGAPLAIALATGQIVDMGVVESALPPSFASDECAAAATLPIHGPVAEGDDRKTSGAMSTRAENVRGEIDGPAIVSHEVEVELEGGAPEVFESMASDMLAVVHGDAHDATAVLAKEERADHAASDGEWQVTTVELSLPSAGPLDFDALIQFALDQGTAQVEAAGSPLNPFLVTDTGRAHFFVCLAGDGDPLEVALRTLRSEGERAASCALVLDTRITTRDGTVSDAILVMASRRGEPEGVTWAQAYKPKGWFRKFKVLPFREQVATSRSLFDAADAGR